MDTRLLAFAKQMRQNPGPTESLLWSLIRNAQVGGFRFRRQHVIEPYIADFYCAIAKVVIEVDGETHLGCEADDARRTASLQARECVVLRFWNTTVFDDRDAVVEQIYQTCLERVQADPTVRHRLDTNGQIATKDRK